LYPLLHPAGMTMQTEAPFIPRFVMCALGAEKRPLYRVL
jgi:hypothetical protein